MLQQIKPIETHYKGYRFRSRLEAKWAVFFDALGLQWQYEPEGFNLPSGPYLPDFWVKHPIMKDEGWGWWLEIKPKSPDQVAFTKAMELSVNTKHNTIFVVGNPWPSEHQIIRLACAAHPPIVVVRQEFCIDPYYETISGPFPLYTNADELKEAFNLARSARFEHGESPVFTHKLAGAQ